MARPGRPHKPTALKKLQGTLQPCRTNPSEWSPPTGAPEMPEGFSAGEEREWRRLCGLLVPPGIVTTAEGPVLEAYVKAWSTARAADRRIAKEGLTTETANGYMANPLIAVSRRSWDAVARIGGLLGLDPSSRSKLQVPKPKEEDPMQAFLTGKDRALRAVK